MKLHACFVSNVLEFTVDVNWLGFIDPKLYARKFVRQNFSIEGKCWWPTFLDVPWLATHRANQSGPMEANMMPSV